MPDEEAVQYIRDNLGKHPLEQLKQALIQSGFEPDEVEEAVYVATGSPEIPAAPKPFPRPAKAAPPAAGPGPAVTEPEPEAEDPKPAASEPEPAAAKPSPLDPKEAPDSGPERGDDLIRLTHRRFFANAALLLFRPSRFFSRLDPHDGPGGAILNWFIWVVIAITLQSAALWARGLPGAGRYALLAAAVAFFSSLAVMVLLIMLSPVFHVACVALGGRGPMGASFIVASAMAPLAAAAPALLSVLSAHPSARLVVDGVLLLYVLVLAVEAASGVYGTKRLGAAVLFTLLAAMTWGMGYGASKAARTLKDKAEDLTRPSKKKRPPARGLAGLPARKRRRVRPGMKVSFNTVAEKDREGFLKTVSWLAAHRPALLKGLTSPGLTPAERDLLDGSFSTDGRFAEIVYFNRYGEVRWAADPMLEGRPYRELSKSRPAKTDALEKSFDRMHVMIRPIAGEDAYELAFPLVACGEVQGMLSLRVSGPPLRDSAAPAPKFPVFRHNCPFPRGGAEEAP